MFRTQFIFLKFLSLVLFLTLPGKLKAQSLNSDNAGHKETTAYPTYPVNDPIYFFCTGEGVNAANLTARSAGSSVTFLWEKFDQVAVKFVNFSNETGTSSNIKTLADGCYRVSFAENGTSYQFRAWVLNGWSRPVATYTQTICTLFRLSSAVTGANYQYYDLSTGNPVPLSSNYQFNWYAGTTFISSAQNPTIYIPPVGNTVYRVEVSDRAGCKNSAQVNYTSPVPVAKFTWSTPQQSDPQYSYPQAPADIDFKNLSENSDPDKYEWYLFKDKAVLESMGGGTAVIDSFMEVLYDVNPLYTYELSGKYKVKLVAAKTVQALTCRDTFYLPDYIIVDTSLVKVSPVFTPNGDGVNDMLIIKTRSLQTLDFTVLNRWGKVVHHFSSNNYIPSESEIAAWDGRKGGSLCPAGVYFWVVDAKGRDGERRREKGFVQMIW